MKANIQIFLYKVISHLSLKRGSKESYRPFTILPVIVKIFEKLQIFNIFLCDLFLILNDIDNASDVNDITLYKACNKVDTTVKTLRMSTKNLFTWCKDNQVKGNTGKNYLILRTGNSNPIQLGIN